MQIEQDWTPVILKKKMPETTRKIIPKISHSKSISSLSSGVKLNDNDEVVNIKYVSKDIANLITSARCIKKLTRKQLAQALNIKEDVIANIETCKAIYNGNLIAKIKKYLNIL
jgi:ribosome-binding protein aMBF1 (putative translation factor)